MYVVARSKHQRLECVSNLFWRLLVNFALSRRGVEQNEVFLKRRRLRCHFAIQRQRDAGTIEYQAIVAAYLVHVHDWKLVAQCNRAQHIDPQRSLVDGVRRRRNIDNYAGSLRREFRDRVAVVPPDRPKVFIVPDVFANCDAQHFPAESENFLFGRRLKVSRLVKNVVSRQQHFALFKDDFAAAKKCRFVCYAAARAIFVLTDKSNNGRQWQLCRQLLQFFLVSINEGGAFQ